MKSIVSGIIALVFAICMVALVYEMAEPFVLFITFVVSFCFMYKAEKYLLTIAF